MKTSEMDARIIVAFNNNITIFVYFSLLLKRCYFNMFQYNLLSLVYVIGVILGPIPP